MTPYGPSELQATTDAQQPCIVHQMQTFDDSYLLPWTFLPGQDLKVSDTHQVFGVWLFNRAQPPSPSCLRACFASSEKGDAGSRSRAWRNAALASSGFPAWDRASPRP